MDKAFMAGVMGLLFGPQEMKFLPSSGGVGERVIKRRCDPKKKKRRQMTRDSRRRNRG
jgi:hypothetical protein